MPVSPKLDKQFFSQLILERCVRKYRKVIVVWNGMRGQIRFNTHSTYQWAAGESSRAIQESPRIKAVFHVDKETS